ncbi:MAG: CFI-box-CTERM domain-containing protein [Planctomycetota bacterium]
MWTNLFRVALTLHLLTWVTEPLPTAYAQTPIVTVLQLSHDGRILTEIDRTTFFNRARCECSTDLSLEASFSVPNDANGRVVVLYGQGCIDSDDELDDDCTIILSEDTSSTPSSFEQQLSVTDMVGGSCGDREETRQIVVAFDEDDAGQWSQLASLSYAVDTDAPPAPVKDRVVAGESLAEVSFEAPSSTADIVSYQVLCRTSSTGEGLPTPREAEFDTAVDICDATIDPTANTARSDRVCADASASTDSVTVFGLQNDIEYIFEVVSIDEAGNPSVPVEIGRTTPAPEQDFWERYRASGGQANGEHCFIATAAYGDYDHPQVRVLRQFRNDVLSRTALGRMLIATYYTLSPPFADAIARAAWRRALTRWTLWPVVLGTQAYLDGWGAPLIALVVAAVMCIWRRRRIHRNLGVSSCG